MDVVVTGLFKDSKQAGEVVSALKNKGYTDRISTIMKGMDGEVKNTDVKGKPVEATIAGATSGGALGVLTGLIAGAVTAVIPGGIILVAGPLAVTWGLTGAAIGALGGGLMGALTDIGFSKEKAAIISESIMKGDVIVTVQGEEANAADIESILQTYGAVETSQLAKS